MLGDDKEVSHFYMVRFCPHYLFVNTRSDLGPCPWIHGLKQKESFEKSPRHDSYVPKFEAKLAYFCKKLFLDLDRKARHGWESLAQESKLLLLLQSQVGSLSNLSALEERMKNPLEQVETFGEEGQVDEAGALKRKVEMPNVESTVLTQPQNEKTMILTQERWHYVSLVSVVLRDRSLGRTFSLILSLIPSLGFAWMNPWERPVILPKTRKELQGDMLGDDKEVSHFYMVRFCPHYLFVNTRSDLGPCPWIHGLKQKESFEKSPRHDSYVPKFEAKLAYFCKKLFLDLDRKARHGWESLAQESKLLLLLQSQVGSLSNLSALEERMKNPLEQVETFGEEGQVDEAGALKRKVEMPNVESTVLTQPQNEKTMILTQERWHYVSLVSVVLRDRSLGRTFSLILSLIPSLGFAWLMIRF
ncbi:hypothetical protein NE237_015188 [Protea cynaroides]|uniref:Uncharacterized protein n=1 Tax=Protea cynaroides TaxID=273540 RepID=A0A9Q0QQT4_9MAGN|nr:hypothetical protein NE237_015188 [Protea cynaroides]